MRVAVLPPCFYPPKLYFEMIRASDMCVLLSEIPYIKHSWINRNKLKDDGWMTVPVYAPAFKTPIHKVQVCSFDSWHAQLLTRIYRLYGKKFVDGHPIVEDFKIIPEVGDKLLSILRHTISSVLKYYNIENTLVDSRDITTSEKKGQECILEICRRVGATEYLHPPCGYSYDCRAFNRQGIRINNFHNRQNWSSLSVLHDAMVWWM